MPLLCKHNVIHAQPNKTIREAKYMWLKPTQQRSLCSLLLPGCAPPLQLTTSLGCVWALPGPGSWWWTQRALHSPVISPTTGALVPVAAVDETARGVVPGVADPVRPVCWGLAGCLAPGSRVLIPGPPFPAGASQALTSWHDSQLRRLALCRWLPRLCWGQGALRRHVVGLEAQLAGLPPAVLLRHECDSEERVVHLGPVDAGQVGGVLAEHIVIALPACPSAAPGLTDDLV